ncbi:uncharacterized protein LOC142350813 [Convolutriloba macropyga]|uniref:uncharacterized protein LOC142350813 n=1 Tax=Convolutriloba macropyga TaxID=536237 RepID=UPI003F522D8C
MHCLFANVNRRNRFMFCQKVKDNDFVSSAKSFLLKCDYQNKFDGILYQLSERIIGLLWNLCDISDGICQQVVEANFHEMFIQDLKDNEMLALEKLDDSETDTFNPESGRQRVHSYLGVMFNLLKTYPESREELQKFGLIEVLLKLIFVEDELLKSVVVSTLAFAVDVHREDQQSLKSVRRPVISFLVQRLLITSVENENVTQQSMKKSFKTTTEGRAVHFCASEVFEFLSRLAVNGNNATEMIKQGVFAICESFLETSCENEAAMTLADTSKHPAIHWALRLLWRISFIREALFMFTFKDLIKCFRDHPSTEIVESATGLIFSLEKLSVSNNVPTGRDTVDKKYSSDEKQSSSWMSAQKSDTQNKGQISVMISYSWKQKETILRLRKELDEIGKFKIWIDDDHMHKSRNIRAEMANAIDGADFVICCYSKAYAESENCMTEFNYSCDFKKNMVFVRVETSESDYKPRGNLGAVVAGKFYFDLATPENFDQNFPKLVERLG